MTPGGSPRFRLPPSHVLHTVGPFTERPIRVFLLLNEALTRDVIRSVLEAEPEITVVKGAGTFSKLTAAVVPIESDVVLLEAAFGDHQTPRVIEEVRARCSGARVILLARRDDAFDIVASIEAGAAGYITVDRPLSQLINAIRAVFSGEMAIPSSKLGEMFAHMFSREELEVRAGQMLAGLTRRELEILQLLTKGASSASIAADLYISPKTVRTHTQNILKKLGVHSKLEAVALVARSRSE